MNTLSTISAGLTGYLLSSILPGILAILGLMVAMVFAVYGTLLVYAHLTGKSSKDVFYTMGHVFGEEIYESQYDRYKAKRRDRARRDIFRQRYDREN